jgi:hypothetical protein
LASGGRGGGEVTKIFFPDIPKKIFPDLPNTNILPDYQNIFHNITEFSQRYKIFFRTSKFFRNFYVLPEFRIDFCPTVKILGGHVPPPCAPSPYAYEPRRWMGTTYLVPRLFLLRSSRKEAGYEVGVGKGIVDHRDTGRFPACAKTRNGTKLNHRKHRNKTSGTAETKIAKIKTKIKRR